MQVVTIVASYSRLHQAGGDPGGRERVKGIKGGGVSTRVVYGIRVQYQTRNPGWIVLHSVLGMCMVLGPNTNACIAKLRPRIVSATMN